MYIYSSIIYILLCNDNYYYIGSTRTSINERLIAHKSAAKRLPNRSVYKHINTIGWENVEAHIIENYPCKDRNELNQRENFYIQQAKNTEDMFCLNINSAYNTDYQLKLKQQAYRTENSEKIKKYRKVYNKIFSEKRNEYQKNYAAQNKEKIIKVRKLKYEKNKEKELQQMKQYNEEHKEKIAANKKKWAENNKETLTKKRKEYAKIHKEEIQTRGKEYYAANKDIINEKSRQYYNDNKEKYAIYAAKQNIQIECKCGAMCLKNNLSKHMKTKTHTNWLAISSINIEQIL